MPDAENGSHRGSNPDPHLNPARTPADIEAESFRIIDAEVPEPRPFTGLAWSVVRRMIHTTADFELLELVRISPGALEAGVAALMASASILTDTEMARAGIPARRTEPLGCRVRCLMRDDRVGEMARAQGGTRARAAVDLAVDEGGADIWVVGNAPTALVRLLEHAGAGRTAPKLVVGMPVGFVNAAESKQLLMASGLEHVTIAGRKGGSALAACVVNALADAALERTAE